MEGATFLHGDADQAALGPLGRLADRFGNLARLAGAVADAALLVTHDHQGGEGEPAAAFDHFRDAVDRHQLVDEIITAFAAIVIAIAVAATTATAAFPCFTCHCD